MDNINNIDKLKNIETEEFRDIRLKNANYENRKKLIKSIYTIIEKLSGEEPKKYIKHITSTIIGEDYNLLDTQKYNKCLERENKKIKLSSRFIMYCDISKNIKTKPKNIINVLPSFWFKTTKTPFILTKLLMFEQCRKIYDDIVLIDEADETANNSERLSKLKLSEKYDMIHAELFIDRATSETYYIIDNYFISLMEFIYNNLNIGGNVLIHLVHVEATLMKFLRNLISNNIFTDFDLINPKHVTIYSLSNYAIFLQLNNYTGKRTSKDELEKNTNIDDLKENLENRGLTIFDVLTSYYYEISDYRTEVQIENFIKNNILDYCSKIGLKIETPEMTKGKMNIIKFFNIKNNTLYVPTNLNTAFHKYCVIKGIEVDTSIKQKSYSVVYLENWFDEISEIFLNIIKYWFFIDKFGLLIIDNNNDNNNNFNFTISQLSMLLNKNMVIKNTNYYTVIGKLND